MYRTAPRKQNEPTSKIVILTSLRFLPAYLSGSPRWYQIHTSYSCSTLSLLPHILPRLSFLVQTAGIYQFPSPYLEIIHCYNNNTSGIFCLLKFPSEMFPITFYIGILLIITIANWIYKWRNPQCNGVLPPGSMGWPLLGETLQFFAPNTSSDVPPFVRDRMKR